MFEGLGYWVTGGELTWLLRGFDFWDKYKNPTEPIFKTTYNAYLEANEQEGGIESYNYVVELMVHYFDDKI